MADRDPEPGGDGDRLIDFRLLSPDEWHLARQARLAALRDAPQSFLPTQPPESSWTEQGWRRSCETGLWAVARSGGGVAGLARLTRERNGPHLGSVWTHPLFRRRGIASALVRLLVTAQREQERHEPDVFVWVIRPNPAAIRLYTSLGFQRTDEVQLLDGIGRIEERLRLSGVLHRT